MKPPPPRAARRPFAARRRCSPGPAVLDAGLPSPHSVGEGEREARPVQAFDGVGQTHGVARLVGLERADDAEANSGWAGRRPGNSPPLPARGSRRTRPRRRRAPLPPPRPDGFRHGDEGDKVRGAVGADASFGDPVAQAGEVLPDEGGVRRGVVGGGHAVRWVWGPVPVECAGRLPRCLPALLPYRFAISPACSLARCATGFSDRGGKDGGANVAPPPARRGLRPGRAR